MIYPCLLAELISNFNGKKIGQKIKIITKKVAYIIYFLATL